MDITRNFGVIVDSRPTDYIGGQNSPIVFEKRNSTGDWRGFRGSNERQSFRTFDTYGCVSFSALNQWEEEANWMLENNLWPQDALDFFNQYGYINAGKFECSDRFTVKSSGTVPNQGNATYKVHDSIRHDGVVPEAMYPSTETLEEYYQEVPQRIKDLGKESLKHFNWLYESITPTLQNLQNALQHAPLQLVIGTCPPWGERVPVCNMAPNHAILLDHVEDLNMSYDIFDSYDPFSKKLLPGYFISSAVKGVLYPINRVQPVKKPLFTDINNLKYGKTNDDVKTLQKVLNVIEPATGFYGRMTCDAVYAFQKANNLASLLDLLIIRGRYVGPKTMALLEAKFNL